PTATAEKAFLVVMKIAAADGQVRAVAADAGAVQIRHRRAGELDVLHRLVRARHHPDALAVGDGRRRNEMRTPADAAQSQVVGGPGRGRSVVVDAGVDFHYVAALNHPTHLAGMGELSPRTYPDHARR